jgi:hypothetical protein
MSLWHVLSTTLAGRWRLLLTLVAVIAAFAAIDAVAQATPKLGFDAARARTRVAMMNWCHHGHDRKFRVEAYWEWITKCRSYGLVPGRCRRETYLRANGDVVGNPRRITCRGWITWDHFWLGPANGRWHCEDDVTVRITTTKPYLIVTHRHKMPACLQFSTLAARRVPR